MFASLSPSHFAQLADVTPHGANMAAALSGENGGKQSTCEAHPWGAALSAALGELSCLVRMAEWSKALRSGRSPLMWAWVRIPLLTKVLLFFNNSEFKLQDYAIRS